MYKFELSVEQVLWNVDKDKQKVKKYIYWKIPFFKVYLKINWEFVPHKSLK